ncbi:aldehyde dehydrogenase family protein, partial [Luethyella okanaganae]
AQKTFVERLIAEARDSGAEVREFGELPADLALKDGNFVRPALVVDPDPLLGVVVEEQFGPVVPVIPFDTEEEVIRLANGNWAGLGASVWTADAEAARRIGSQMVCGYVWVNDHGAPRLDLRAPFGGMKQSGIGREQGIEGVRAFQDTRSIATIDPVALAVAEH